VPNTFFEFQATLNNMLQNGFVARELQEPLDSDLAFRRQATEETIDGRIGSIIQIPKGGRKGPVVTPLNPNNFMSLDNGMTPSLSGTEMYQYNLQEWGDTADVDILGSTALAADLIRKASRDNGVQAAQSLERLAKITVHGAYEGGNSWVRPDLGANTTAVVYVDDIRGFTQVPVNGAFQPVSTTYPLNCVEQQTVAGGISQTFQVVGFVATANNASLYPGSSQNANGQTISDGISGALTIQNCSVGAPVAGDALIAVGAAKVVRPLNKPSYNTLNAGDACTLGVLLDAKTRLAQNNVPPFDDGMYHFVHDHVVNRQLFADQQFLTAYAARYKSEEYQKGQVFELLGILFLPSTECYVQPPTPALGINVPIRRSILMGGGTLNQGNYGPANMYINQDGINPIGGFMMVNGVNQIVRPPIDRQLRIVSLTWTWTGAYTCQTDMLTTPLIIPTSSNAFYKRACVIQTAG
jgi:hypothetical protein